MSPVSANSGNPFVIAASEAKELGKAIKIYGKEFPSNMAWEAAREARRIAPVDTGLYRSSVKSNRSSVWVIAGHALTVEERHHVMYRALTVGETRGWAVLQSRIRLAAGV